MLTKKLWNLTQSSSSTAYKILEAKYFRGNEIMQAQLGYKPSYLWRSLLAARELVKHGMAWRIEDGKSVKIGEDRWTGTENIQKITSILPYESRSKSVCYLMHGTSGRWDKERVESMFNAHDAQRILALPLSYRNPKDRRVWRFTKHGFFTVKSAYHAAVSLYSPSNLKFCSASVIPTGWKKLWHIKAIPRVRLFIWKACSNSLPTKANLHKRHCIEDPICELCGEQAETVDHLLLHCAATHLVWYSSPLRLDTKKQEGLTFKEFVWSSIEKFPPEYVSMLAHLAWEIWSAHNAKYFENSPFEFQRITQKAMNRSIAGEELKETTLTQVRAKERVTVWKKPIFGRHKMNSDIEVWPDGRVGIGFLIRDHEGGVILAGKKEVQAEGSTNLLEGLAMLYGLQMALQYHITIDEAESDNKNTVESVTGKERLEIYMDIVVADIVDTTKKVGCTNVIHGERLANKAAHHIAHGRDFISIRHCPNHVASFIYQDVMTG